MTAGAETRARPKLAVMTIIDGKAELNPTLVDSLTDALRTRLAQGASFVVIDKSRHVAALRQLAKKNKHRRYGSCHHSRCQIPLGRALSADSLLRTKLSRVGSNLLLHAELVDLSKETVLGAAQAAVPAAGEQLDDRLLAAIYQLADQLNTAPPADEQGPRSEADAPVSHQASLPRPRPNTAARRRVTRGRYVLSSYSNRRKRRQRASLGWTLLSGGAISLGYGAVGLLVLVPSAVEDADQATSPGALEKAAEDVKSKRILSLVLLGAGAAVTALGSYLLWTMPPRRTVRVAGIELSGLPEAVPLPGGAALTLRGRF